MNGKKREVKGTCLEWKMEKKFATSHSQKSFSQEKEPYYLSAQGRETCHTLLWDALRYFAIKI